MTKRAKKRAKAPLEKRRQAAALYRQNKARMTLEADALFKKIVDDVNDLSRATGIPVSIVARTALKTSKITKSKRATNSKNAFVAVRMAEINSSEFQFFLRFLVH